MDYLGIAITIVEYVFIIELILIAIILMSTYFLKSWSNKREARRLKTTSNIEKHFQEVIDKNKAYNDKSLPNDWRQARTLFPAFLKYDSQFTKNKTWTDNRMNILNQTLLPIARKTSVSKSWIKRFFALETFTLAPNKQDEAAIVKLTKDKIPLVFLHSIPAAIKVESATGINNIITRLAKYSWMPQLLYLESFRNASQGVRHIVEQRLQIAKEPKVRAVCYKILAELPPGTLKVDPADLKSADFELRLAALKYMTYVEKDKAITQLIEALKDPHWEIRLAAVHRLGYLKADAAIDAIANTLNDPDWSVKISAAETLKSFGAKGNAVLRAKSPELADIPYDPSKRLTHALW